MGFITVNTTKGEVLLDVSTIQAVEPTPASNNSVIRTSLGQEYVVRMEYAELADALFHEGVLTGDLDESEEGIEIPLSSLLVVFLEWLDRGTADALGDDRGKVVEAFLVWYADSDD